MTVDVRIGVIGGGFMGGGIVRGLLARAVVAPADVAICEPVAARRTELQEQHGVLATADPAAATAGCDVVLIAVKPQDFASAAEAIRPSLPPNPLLISVMAGVPLARITGALPRERAVRVMPNLGATVGEAYSMWCGTPAVTEEDRTLMRCLLGAIGREREAAAETYLDMATAVAGSGPGYVTLLIEGLIDGAVHIGLPRQVATEMVLQTVLGTVRWAQSDGRHPAELRAQVVSPGGTTAEGVLALERGGVRAALVQATIAAFEKSRALGS